MTNPEKYDVVIIGAGAAGLMCAAQAGQAGMRVLLLEKADRPGKKIRISGGGRCNFTNLEIAPERYISENRHFMKSALRSYTATDFLSLVESYGIRWHEKTLGQLFCDTSAKEIIAMLLAECRKGGVTLRTNVSVTRVLQHQGSYQLQLDSGAVRGRALVIATGGPAIPKMGASGFASEVARQFGMETVPWRPALVPLTLGPEAQVFKGLSGVATQVVARCGKAQFREALLFTHKGLSGPAILQISSYWRAGDDISVDFFPDFPPDWLVKLKGEKPRSGLKSALARVLPERLATVFADIVNLSEPLGDCKDRRLNDIAQQLSNWRFSPTGTEGFAKAEVAAGGVSTKALSSKTLESVKNPGLYFIGEAVDVTGWLGGYNFQWAWSSGVAAARALAKDYALG